MVRAFRGIGVVVVSMLLAGCYTLQPARGVTPEPGAKIAFDINDAGRVALGGTMGPEIWQIEGQLVEKDATQYIVAVSMVHLARGGEQVWTGERVPIKTEYVSSVYQRKFSATKTALLAGAGVALVATVAGKALIGSVGRDPPGLPIDSSASVRRPR